MGKRIRTDVGLTAAFSTRHISTREPGRTTASETLVTPGTRKRPLAGAIENEPPRSAAKSHGPR